MPLALPSYPCQIPRNLFAKGRWPMYKKFKKPTFQFTHFNYIEARKKEQQKRKKKITKKKNKIPQCAISLQREWFAFSCYNGVIISSTGPKVLVKDPEPRGSF